MHFHRDDDPFKIAKNGVAALRKAKLINRHEEEPLAAMEPSGRIICIQMAFNEKSHNLIDAKEAIEDPGDEIVFDYGIPKEPTIHELAEAAGMNIVDYILERM